MTPRAADFRALEAPRSEAELLERARSLAGRTLGQVAKAAGFAAPRSNLRSKGWAGQLLEAILGATAGSLSMPDFPHLGVELKTIPVDARGRPQESTHVCAVTLLPQEIGTFERSCVFRKLARVLWFPVQCGPQPPLAERRLGRAVLWSPSEADLDLLRADFEELMEMVSTGRVAELTARHGEVLQIRPKGASAAERVPALGPDGTRIATNPRGFYLRPAFTGAALTADAP